MQDRGGGGLNFQICLPSLINAPSYTKPKMSSCPDFLGETNGARCRHEASQDDQKKMTKVDLVR